MALDQPTAARPLVVRIRNWVGDVVLGLPALQLLQQQGYQLHIVARRKWAQPLLAGYPWPVLLQPASLADRVAQLRELRRHCVALDPGFDQRENAFVLPVSFSSALEMRLAGLKAVGVAKEGRSLLLQRAEPWATRGHELERFWDIACRFVHHHTPPPAHIGLQVAPAARARAQQLLQARGINGAFVMICPFAGGRAARADKADKRWPGFADFVAQAEQRLGVPVVVNPGPGEDEEARLHYSAAHTIAGSDLADYAALLERATLVVANDTGPAHMAAALGRPVISVLGPTEAARWRPWGPGVQVLQVLTGGSAAGSCGSSHWPTAEAALQLAQQTLAAPA